MRVEVSKIISEFYKRESGRKKPIILCVGLSGVGKTTNSKYLARKLEGYEALNLEEIREDLGLTKFSRKDTPMLHTIVVYNIEKLSEEGKGIIFDANLKSYDLRETYYELAKALGKDIIVIEFVCDDDEVINRINSRKIRDGRINSPADPSIYLRQKKVWQDVGIDTELNNEVLHIKYDSFRDKAEVVRGNKRQEELINEMVRLMEGKINDIESFPNGLQ
jgi:predicted kinase